MISESSLLLLLPFVEIDRLVENELRLTLFNHISTLPKRNTVHEFREICFDNNFLYDRKPLILDQVSDLGEPTLNEGPKFNVTIVHLWNFGFSMQC